jgi:hypothetical protein
MSLSTRGVLEAYELPIEVIVTAGHYGKTNEQSLSEGEAV